MSEPINHPFNQKHFWILIVSKLDDHAGERIAKIIAE